MAHTPLITNAPITWQKTQTGAIGTLSTQTYTYTPEAIVNYEAFSGSLSYADTATTIRWTTNIQTSPYQALGEFFWRAGSTEWHYNAATRQWGVTGNQLIWFHSSTIDPLTDRTIQHLWMHAAKEDSWIFKTSVPRENFPHFWQHVITDTGDPTSNSPLPPYKEYWGYNRSTGEWKNITRNQTVFDNTWRFNQETMRWSHNATPEVWECDPLLETFSLIGENIARNRWRHITKNIWLEEAVGIEWEYLRPEAESISKWKNRTTQEEWSFDENLQQWIPLSGSGPSRYFPPLVPPVFAIQTEEIVALYRELELHTFLDPDFAGECELHNGSHILTIARDGSFNLTLPTLSAHVGGGTFYNYTESFETSWGEKWRQDPTTIGTANNILYLNVSTTITTQHLISHNTSQGHWAITGTAFEWCYKSADDLWQENTIGLTYSFNPDTSIWTNTATHTQWRYEFNSDIQTWTWKNLTSGEVWRHKEQQPEYPKGKTRGKSDGLPLWENVTTGTSWFPSVYFSDNTMLPMYIDATNTFDPSSQLYWTYNPITHLWHSTQEPNTNGLEIFPCIPGTISGYVEYIKKLSKTDTTSTSPLSPLHGIYARIAEAKEEIQTHTTSVDNLITTMTGLTLQEALLPTLAQINYAAKKNLLLFQEYDHLTNPLQEKGSSFQPTANAGFTHWNEIEWKFDTPGKGALTFQVTRPQGCVIGFAPEPTEDGSAPYTLKIYLEQNTNPNAELPLDETYKEYYTIYLITLMKGETELSVQGKPYLSVGQTGRADGFKLWCTYNNGHIMVGIGDPLTALRIEHGTGLLFDYTLVDGDTPSAIQYFSFADNYVPQGSYDPESFTTFFHTGDIACIQSYNYDIFSAQVEIVDVLNTCQDYVRLIPFDIEWTALKAKLNAVTTYGLTYREKSTISKTLFDDLLARRVTPGAEGLSTASQTYNDYLSSGLLFGTETLKVFNDFATEKLYAYDDSITALLTASTKPLSVDSKQALFDTASRAILDFTLFADNGIFTLLENDLDSLTSSDQNTDFIPYRTFIHEENDILECMSTGLEILGPPMLERFFAEIPVTVGPPENDPGLTPLDELKAAEAQAKIDTQHAVVQRVVDGISTPFAGATALAMLFFINSNFDNIRLTINDYINTNNYSTFHTIAAPGSPLRSHTYLYGLFSKIIKDLDPLLKTTGNTFAPPFAGTQKNPQLKSNETYLVKTVTSADTGTVADQQKDLEAGTVNYPKNTGVTTASDAEMRTTIREILAADVPKTEAYSRIYIKDALIALGNGNYTKESRKALSLLGAATITPEGNCVITLNSDILISGPNFLSPSSSFGSDLTNATRCIPAIPTRQRGHHEITFYSPVERTITIASETELDLSAFAQGLVLNGQKITFAGKVKLVFEPNTRLRLPYTPQNQRAYCLTVAFKDDAELIFEGIENYDMSSFTDALNGPDLVRSKILGCGILEFSGSAKAKILKSALVSVEADYTSNITNLELKMTEDSQWLIGTSTIAGGGFQIGNIQDGGSNNLDIDNYPNNTTHARYGSLDDPFIPRTTHIDFTLTLLGKNSQFFIGRSGFFGLGVGSINKEGVINGTESSNPWTLQSLYNTGNITLNLQGGTFWHQNIADGNNSNASLWAIGPHSGRTLYRLIMNKKKNTLIKGGGNVMLVRTNYTSPQPISVLTSIQPLVGDMTDSGKYSLLAPPPVIMLRQESDPDHPGYKKYGSAVITETATEYAISGQYDDFFKAITLQTLSNNGKYALAYNQESQNKFTLIDSSGTILTSPIKLRQVKDQGNKKVTPKNVASEGFVKSNIATAHPQRLIKPKAAQ